MSMTRPMKSILSTILSRCPFSQYPKDKQGLGLLFIAALTTSGNLYAESLTVYYETRPPFMFLENNELKGSFGAQATAAFKNAGIAFTLSEAPVARQQLIISSNKEPACAVGFYWTSTRAKSGKYTLAIAHGSPQGIIFRDDNPKLASTNSIASLFSNPDISIVLRNGYSYGETLDNMLQKAKAQILRPPEDSHGRVKLVFRGIVDAALFAPDEAEYQIKQFNAQPNTLKFRQFYDSPEGKLRYIYCSKMVDDQIIAKVNQAIKNPIFSVRCHHEFSTRYLKQYSSRSVSDYPTTIHNCSQLLLTFQSFTPHKS